MKVTVEYYCENCREAFSAYCGVPDELDNASIGHGCAGVSKFNGVDGTDVSYTCVECGHPSHDDVVNMMPALATKTHGCGRECRPA